MRKKHRFLLYGIAARLANRFLLLEFDYPVTMPFSNTSRDAVERLTESIFSGGGL